jgi:membrane protease subunit HflC
MRTDRQKIADQLRAEGEQEALTRRADADRQAEVILAEADRDANRLRGEGEAQAISILADALNQNPEFFSFRRSLDAYRQFLNQQSTMILSSESDLFKFLQSPEEALEEE